MSSSQIDSFFANGEHINNVNKIVGDTSSTGERSKAIDVAGSYIMRCKSIVAKKKDGELMVFPRVGLSESVKSAGALQLHIALEVVEGTEAVVVGSTLFHTITMSQPAGAAPEKVRNTIGYMKPVICALIGKDSFDLTKEFVEGVLMIEYNEDTLAITKDHGMKNNVMVICEEYSKSNGTVGIKVKTIRNVRIGEHSVSIKREASAESELVKMSNTIAASTGNVIVEKIEDSLDYDPSLDVEPIIEDA